MSQAHQSVARLPCRGKIIHEKIGFLCFCVFPRLQWNFSGFLPQFATLACKILDDRTLVEVVMALKLYLKHNSIIWTQKPVIKILWKHFEKITFLNFFRILRLKQASYLRPRHMVILGRLYALVTSQNGSKIENFIILITFSSFHLKKHRCTFLTLTSPSLSVYSPLYL